MSDGGDMPKVDNLCFETSQPGTETKDEEQEQDSFEIDELDLSDRESEDIDVNHRRIKRISKLETIPNVIYLIHTICCRRKSYVSGTTSSKRLKT